MDIQESYVRGLFPDSKFSPLEIVTDALQYYRLFTKNINTFDNKCNIEHLLREEIKNIKYRLFDIPQVSCSSKKGQSGENLVEEWIKTAFPDAIITNTSKSVRSGDLIIRLVNGTKILIEVKNYKNVVPTSEVEKFKRDLTTSNVKFGIFVSIGQRISNFARYNISLCDDKFIVFVPMATYNGFTWAVLACQQLLNIMTDSDISNIKSSNIKQKLISMKNEIQTTQPTFKRIIANMENVIKKIKLIMSGNNKLILDFIDPIILSLSDNL